MSHRPRRQGRDAGTALIVLQQAIAALSSNIARLVFLSGLRDQNNRFYRQPIGPQTPKDARRGASLLGMHEAVFSKWLNCRVEEQKADLEWYFSSSSSDKAEMAHVWLRLQRYRSLPPISANAAEKELFNEDFRKLLLQIVWGVSTCDPPAERLLITTKELCAWLSVSGRSLSLWVQRGMIPAVKVGRQWRFSTAEIWAWLRERRTAPMRPASGLPKCNTCILRRDAGQNAHLSKCMIRCHGVGSPRLTSREEAVLAWIGQGKTSKEIGSLLSISAKTVGEHRKHICAKLGVHSSAELVACAARSLTGSCRRAHDRGPVRHLPDIAA